MLNLKDRMKKNESVVQEPIGAGQAVNPPESALLAKMKAKVSSILPSKTEPKTEPKAEPKAEQKEESKIDIKTSIAAKIANKENKAVSKTEIAPKAALKIETKKPAATAIKKNGFTLYIGCSPNKECTQFGDFIAPVLDTIKKEKGSHYRLIEGLYGGNSAVLAEYLADYLTINPPQNDIVMDLSSTEAKDSVEVLSQRAAMIVRGF